MGYLSFQLFSKAVRGECRIGGCCWRTVGCSRVVQKLQFIRSKTGVVNKLPCVPSCTYVGWSVSSRNVGKLSYTSMLLLGELVRQSNKNCLLLANIWLNNTGKFNPQLKQDQNDMNTRGQIFRSLFLETTFVINFN